VRCKLPADLNLSVVVFSPSLVLKIGDEDGGSWFDIESVISWGRVVYQNCFGEFVKGPSDCLVKASVTDQKSGFSTPSFAVRESATNLLKAFSSLSESL
jgi:hypothetical protein